MTYWLKFLDEIINFLKNVVSYIGLLTC